MAMVNVKRDPTGTVGPIYTPDGVTGQKRYTVLLDGADSADDAPVVAAGAAGLPSLFGYWSASEPRLRCIEIRPTPLDGSWLLWEVAFQYATGPGSEDPLDEPPDISTDSYTVRELREFDRNGLLIANTAGDPVDLEEDIEFEVLRIGRNVASHSFITEARYRGSLNLNPILGAPAETLWMRTFRAAKVIKSDLVYWRQEMEIVFNHLLQPSGEAADNAPSNGYRTWARRVANKGRRVKVAYSPYLDDIRITDTASPNCGDPISNDVYLNAAGTAAQSTCRWRYFYTRPAVNWSPLHLSLT